MYSNMRSRMGIALIFYFSCVCSGQQTDSYDLIELSFGHLTINDGLSQNHIEKIIQDKQGFMWFGTRDGLNRYDGYEFKIYRHDPKDPGSISGNEIKDLLETRNGELWIVAGGINKYDRNNNVFINLRFDNQNSIDFSSEGIVALCEDKIGDLWIAIYEKGLFKIQVKSQVVNGGMNQYQADQYEIEYNLIGPYARSSENSESLQCDLFMDILVDHQNNLWVATRSGLFTLQSNSNGELPDPDQADFKKIYAGDILKNQPHTHIFQDKNNQVWIGTEHGLIKHCEKYTRQGSFEFFSYPDKLFDNLWKGTINTIEEDDNGILWLGTLDGVFLFDPANERYSIVASDPGRESSLSMKNIRQIYRDNGNVMWLGTGGGGVDKYVNNNKPFKQHLDENRYMSKYSTYSITQDKQGVIWLSISNGSVFQYHPITRSLSQFSLGGFPEVVATDMEVDGNGNILMVANNYLFRIEPANKRITDTLMIWNNQSNYIPSDLVPRLYLSENEKIWLCNTKNLMLVNLESHNLNTYNIQFENLGKVNSLYSDRDGIFWIGTMNGLVRFDILNNQQELFKKSDNSIIQLSSSRINDILPDPDPESNLIWIATGHGFLSLNTQTHKSSLFTVEKGLANNYVYCILHDNDDNLWLSTNYGLSKFNITEESFTNYTINDGLQSNEFNLNAKFKSTKGELFFGGINGITSFYPDKIGSNPHIPQVVITDFYLFYNSIDPKQDGSPLPQMINVTDRIELKYNQNNVAFQFAALDFTNPEKNQYKYILENFDDHWINVDGIRRASYSNLSPGKYEFKVKGSNNDLVWSQESDTMEIIIHPPFWRTWWAYVIYICGSLFIIYIFSRYQGLRIKLKEQLKYKQEELKKRAELDKFKSNFFAGISHELRTPLTLILGKLQDLLSEGELKLAKEKLQSLTKHSSELLAMSDQILELSRIQSGKLKAKYEHLDIIFYVENLIDSLIPKASQKKIDLELNTDLDDLYMTFDAEALRKILQNLISNAIKFSPNYSTFQIAVDIIITDGGEDCVRIRVIDQGIGIEKDKMSQIFDMFYQVNTNKTEVTGGFGIGLWLCKELVEHQNGSISVDSNIGEGSTFSVVLPINQDLINSQIPVRPKIQAEDISGEGELISTSNMHILSADKSDKQFLSVENFILIVEDHPDLRSYIAEILEKDYSVLLASDGEEGLEKAIQMIPDIIISDIMMPKMDGYDLAIKIKEDIRTNHIPFLFLTAKAEEADRLKALELGVNDYLIKPFRRKELIQRISNLLKLRDSIKYNVQHPDLVNPKKQHQPEFLKIIDEIIADNIENEDLGVEFLCREIGISRTQLHRKLRGITQLTAVQMIQDAKLNEAQQMLKQGLRVSETAYKLGYNSPAHFTKIFKKKFGYSPKSLQSLSD